MRLSVRVRAQNALSRDVPRLECAFPSRRGAREVWGNPPARLRGTMENASTGQMRSSNHPPACGAGCARVRRSRFGVWPQGKAHSARPVGSKCAFPSQRDRKMRLSVECAFPYLGKRGAASRKSAFSNRHLTEKRILQPAPHGKAHSARWASRKSAFSNRRLTEKRILQPAPHGKAQSATAPRPQRDGKAHSAHNASRKAHSAIPRRPSYVFL